MRALFRNLNERYKAYTRNLGNEEALYSSVTIEKFLSGPGFGGSTGVFFDLSKSDDVFKTKKKKLGDIDIYIPRESYVNHL